MLIKLTENDTSKILYLNADLIERLSLPTGTNAKGCIIGMASGRYYNVRETQDEVRTAWPLPSCDLPSPITTGIATRGTHAFAVRMPKNNRKKT